MLCGASRPGHFDGVTQVVSKLLNQAGADMAFFGEKDWQQLAVIRRMVCDLDIPTQIIGVPIVRDAFGLALSSRNGYLSAAEIEIARQFNVILRKAAYDIASGGYAAEECAKAADAILAAGFDRIDYVECRDAHSLQSKICARFVYRLCTAKIHLILPKIAASLRAKHHHFHAPHPSLMVHPHPLDTATLGTDGAGHWWFGSALGPT